MLGFKDIIMSNILRSFFILAFLLAALQGVTHAEQPDPSFLFRAEVDKTAFQHGETVKVKYYVKNTTQKPGLIFMAPTKEKMVFCSLRDKAASHTDIATFDRQALTSEALIIIRPGRDIEIGEAIFDRTYFPCAGKWQIVINRTYEYSGADIGLNAWTGTLTSNQVFLSIIDK